ncbi:hypothetical protein DFH94DRAFT_712824, partial [Russula ochroleuca]
IRAYECAHSRGGSAPVVLFSAVCGQLLGQVLAGRESGYASIDIPTSSRTLGASVTISNWQCQLAWTLCVAFIWVVVSVAAWSMETGDPVGFAHTLSS